MSDAQPRLVPATILGLADGSMSITGVVFYASHHGGLVFPFALAGGVSAACSMAGGEWLSQSGSGPAASIAMGLATLTGSVLPAAPYAVLSGWHAPAASVAILLAVTAVVARLRGYRAHPYLETGLVLGVVLLASVACALLIPSGTG